MDLFEQLERDMETESRFSVSETLKPFLALLALVLVPCTCVLAVAGTVKILMAWF